MQRENGEFVPHPDMRYEVVAVCAAAIALRDTKADIPKRLFFDRTLLGFNT
jgi:hypothetical protein